MSSERLGRNCQKPWVASRSNSKQGRRARKGLLSLVKPQDMSRFALDVLGTAMLGQTFGATEGKFDDTYRHFPRRKQHPFLVRKPQCVFLSLDSSLDARQYQIVMAELVNPIYLLFPALERLPLPRNIRYRKAVHHMYGMLESFLVGAVEAHVAKALCRLDWNKDVQGQAWRNLRICWICCLVPGWIRKEFCQKAIWCRCFGSSS